MRKKWEEIETVRRDNSREGERPSGNWKGCASQGEFYKKSSRLLCIYKSTKNTKDEPECKVWM